MNQQNFIMMARNVGIDDVKQTASPKVIVQLRPQIRLTHNYRKNDEMCIIFSEDGAVYKIPSRKYLEVIYRAHLENENIEQYLRDVCEKKFEKV